MAWLTLERAVCVVGSMFDKQVQSLDNVEKPSNVGERVPPSLEPSLAPRGHER